MLTPCAQWFDGDRGARFTEVSGVVTGLTASHDKSLIGNRCNSVTRFVKKFLDNCGAAA
jgi:hypothetical protein